MTVDCADAGEWPPFFEDLRYQHPPATLAAGALLAWVRYMICAFTQRIGGRWQALRGERLLEREYPGARWLIRLWLTPMEQVIREVVARLARPMARALLAAYPGHLFLEERAPLSRAGCTLAPYGDRVIARLERLLSIAQDPAPAVRAQAVALVARWLRLRTRIERDRPSIRTLDTPKVQVVVIPQTPPPAPLLVRTLSQAKPYKRE